MATTRVPLCLVGAGGLIGLRHLSHCLEEPRVELTCIVEPTASGPALAAKHALKLYSSVSEMIAARQRGEVRVAGAIVATPNASHVPLGIELLEAGIHALVEKPVSVDVASGRALIAAAATSTATLAVGHHRTFNPYIVNTKKILDSGVLGRVLAVQGVWSCLKARSYFSGPTSWRAEAAAGGPILINLVHDVNLLQHLFGDIVRVYCEEGARTRGHAVEETGACTLKFASGTVGTFIFSDATASPFLFEGATGENPMIPKSSAPVYTILGDRGSVSFPELKVWSYSGQHSSTASAEVPASPGDWTMPMSQAPAIPIDPTPPFTHQLRNFAGVCRGEEEPGCSGLAALKTMAALEAIKQSIATGLPVDMPQS